MTKYPNLFLQDRVIGAKDLSSDLISHCVRTTNINHKAWVTTGSRLLCDLSCVPQHVTGVLTPDVKRLPALMANFMIIIIQRPYRVQLECHHFPARWCYVLSSRDPPRLHHPDGNGGREMIPGCPVYGSRNKSSSWWTVCCWWFSYLSHKLCIRVMGVECWGTPYRTLPERIPEEGYPSFASMELIPTHQSWVPRHGSWDRRWSGTTLNEEATSRPMRAWSSHQYHEGRGVNE